MHRTRLSKLIPGCCFLGLALSAGNTAASEWAWSAPDISLAPDTAPTTSLQLQSPFSESLRFRLGLATSRFDNYVDVNEVQHARPGRSEPIAAALLDYHFNRWGLRFTGGALYSTPTQPGRLLADDRPEADPSRGLYDGAYIDRYQGVDERDQLLPYLGLGWGQAFGTAQRLQLKMDFGVAFQGVSDLDGNISGTNLRGTSGARIDTYRLEDELGWESQFESLRYSFSAGVRYRF